MSGTLLRRLLAPSAVAALSGQIQIANCVGDSCDPPKKVCKKKKEETDCNQTELEKCIVKCKKEFGPVKGAMEEYAEKAGDFAKASARLVMRNVDYLQNCAPEEVKFGAIIGAGLFGFVLGYRRNFLRKVFYGSLGAGTMAAVIYPCETKVAAAQTYFLGKKYIIQGYNKIVGDHDCDIAEKKVCKKKKACPTKED